MSLQTRLSALVTAIGADIKSLGTRVTALEGAGGGGGGTPNVYNTSVLSQNVSGNVDTYLTGSVISIPNGKIQAKSIYRLKVAFAKTAAGASAPVFNVRVGTLGTVADAQIISYTAALQTAAVDECKIEIDVIFRSGGAVTALYMLWKLAHRLATTGFSVTATNVIAPIAGSTFDSTVSGLKIGVSINPGASAVWSTNVVEAELLNLAP